MEQTKNRFQITNDQIDEVASILADNLDYEENVSLDDYAKCDHLIIDTKAKVFWFAPKHFIKILDNKQVTKINLKTVQLWEMN